jgi:hypothetical protein
MDPRKARPRPTRPEASKRSKVSTVKMIPDLRRIASRRATISAGGVASSASSHALITRRPVRSDAPSVSMRWTGAPWKRPAAAWAEAIVPESPEPRMTPRTTSPSSAARANVSRKSAGAGWLVVGTGDSAAILAWNSRAVMSTPSR